MFALAGLFSAEQQAAGLLAMREAALELMQLLGAFRPRLYGCALDGPVVAGSAITYQPRTESSRQGRSVLPLHRT